MPDYIHNPSSTFKNKPPTSVSGFTIFYSVWVLIISRFCIEVTVIRELIWKPRLCSQSPQSLICGTSFSLYLLYLVLGGFSRMHIGRLIVVFVCRYGTFTALRQALSLVYKIVEW
jgi:hypothetical protein